MNGNFMRAQPRTAVSGAVLVVVATLGAGLMAGPGASGQVPPCGGYHGYDGYTGPCPTVTPTPTQTPTAVPTTAPTATPTATPPAPDRRACRLNVRAPRQTLRTVRRSGLKLRLTTDERCRVAVRLLVDRRTARRLELVRRPRGSVVVGQSTRTLPAGTRTVAVKLTNRANRALRNARSVRLAISITTRDTAGNRGRRSLSTTIRR